MTAVSPLFVHQIHDVIRLFEPCVKDRPFSEVASRISQLKCEAIDKEFDRKLLSFLDLAEKEVQKLALMEKSSLSERIAVKRKVRLPLVNFLNHLVGEKTLAYKADLEAALVARDIAKLENIVEKTGILLDFLVANFTVPPARPLRPLEPKIVYLLNPLSAAAFQGDCLAIERLLKLNCDVNLDLLADLTPLMAATFSKVKNQSEVITLLIKNRANPWNRDAAWGWQISHLDFSTLSLEMMQLFLENIPSLSHTKDEQLEMSALDDLIATRAPSTDFSNRLQLHRQKDDVMPFARVAIFYGLKFIHLQEAWEAVDKNKTVALRNTILGTQKLEQRRERRWLNLKVPSSSKLASVLTFLPIPLISIIQGYFETGMQLEVRIGRQCLVAAKQMGILIPNFKRRGVEAQRRREEFVPVPVPE